MAHTQNPQHSDEELKPEIGQIVIYTPAGSADGSYPSIPAPALIQHVAEDGTVCLCVFGPRHPYMVRGVHEGTAPSQWKRERDEPLAEPKKRVIKK